MKIQNKVQKPILECNKKNPCIIVKLKTNHDQENKLPPLKPLEKVPAVQLFKTPIDLL